MQQINFWKQLILRLQSESPAFFKVLRYVALAIAIAINGFNWLQSHQMINIPLTAEWTNILNWAGGAIGGLFGASFLPTTDPALISPEVKEAVLNELPESKLNPPAPTKGVGGQNYG